jgi:hypothetical protein
MIMKWWRLPPTTFTTPSTRRANKHMEPMDERFLRHNRRNADKLDGFKELASKEATSKP